MTIVGIQGGSREERAKLTVTLLSELKARDLRVSVLANAGNSAKIDIPGKDSYEHRRAGAHEVLAVSRLRWALVHESTSQQSDERPPIDHLLARLTPVDILLTPGIAEQASITLKLVPNGSLIAVSQNGTAIAFCLDSSEQIVEFIVNAAAEKRLTS